MKILKTNTGPFEERPYYEGREIEAIVVDELQRTGLFPTTPQPIRVERFIEKRFGIVPTYDELPDGIMGYTMFGSNGVEELVVSRALSDEASGVSERRINTTLAHEAGHILLHGHLFALRRRGRQSVLLEDDIDEENQRILCRDSGGTASVYEYSPSRYDGRWWEYQANKVIGVLLMPLSLIDKSLDHDLVSQNRLGVRLLDERRREEAVQRLSDVFDVNPVVVRIRLGEIFPLAVDGQLTL